MAGSEIKVMWERILNYTITEQKTSNIHEFLKAHGYSSSLIRAIKEDPEGIRLNGEPVLARTLLTPGDQLAIRITETKFSENIVPSDLPLSIVYEDPDLLVINKPAGMPIHPSQGNYDNTLANACAWYFKEKGEPFVYRCINRLDRDTTGLLIIARHLLQCLSPLCHDGTPGNPPGISGTCHGNRPGRRNHHCSNCQKRGFYHRAHSRF